MGRCVFFGLARSVSHRPCFLAGKRVLSSAVRKLLCNGSSMHELCRKKVIDRVFLNTGKSDISRPWVRAPDKCHHRRRPSAATRTPKRGAVIRASKSRSTEFGLKILEHKTSANGYVPLSESPYSESIIVRSSI